MTSCYGDYKNRDPFPKHPIRSLKGGGTKCTTCEKRTNCHDCCTCIWPSVCVTYNIGCDEIIVLNLNPVLNTVDWDCVNNKYDLSVDCNNYVIDIILTYEKEKSVYGDSCYAKLTSEELGLVGDNALVLPFTETSNCRCPVWDFNLNGSQSIQIRPYEFVSVGNQRCINKGPDDCTFGRCVPKRLCAHVYTAARPTRPYKSTLIWYENDQIEIDGCCRANKLPDLLIARFTNFSDDCTCIAPKKSDTIYYPAKHMGNLFTDAGSLVHLKHKVASEYDYYVNNYPNVPSGSHVWESYGYNQDVSDIVLLCPKSLCQTEEPKIEEYSTPLIYGRMIVWHDDLEKVWKVATEIINVTDAIENSNTDYKSKPYDPSNQYSNVHVLNTETLGCNPFHIKTSQFSEPNHCYDEYGNKADTETTLQIHVQEFIGWVGPNPLDPYRKITYYSEVVVVAAPVQNIPDCTAKLHLQEDENFDTFKGRGDSYQIGREWPGYVYGSVDNPTRFVFSGQTGTCKNTEIAAIDIFAEPCGGCPEEPVEDPYAPDVRTECCPNRIPKKLTATFVATNNCAAADGDTFEVNYNDNPQNPESKQWYGTYSGTNCSFCILLECANLTGSYVWRFFISYDCSSYQLVGSTFTVCDPFFFQSQEFSPPACVCLPTGTPNQRAYIIITE